MFKIYIIIAEIYLNMLELDLNMLPSNHIIAKTTLWASGPITLHSLKIVGELPVRRDLVFASAIFRE